MKKTAKTFKLIPIVQSRMEKPAPMALVPALPIRIEKLQGAAEYAIVDTSANISIMLSSVLNDTGLKKQPIGSRIIIRVLGKSLSCEIVKVPIIVCDEGFAPWLLLQEVPFALIPGLEPFSGQSRIVLGYDSCLSNLKLTIDFIRKSLRVLASDSLLVSKDFKKGAELPSRIVEGENLIKLGIYNAALTLIAAGLEEMTYELPRSSSRYSPLGRLNRLLVKKSLPPKLQSRLQYITELRNQAVHGPVGRSITREEAEVALEDAKILVRHFSKLGSK